MVFAFQYQAGQDVAGIGAGVDVDSVGQVFDLQTDRVAMHDRNAVIGGGIEKFFAYPDQVLGRLLFDRNAWADTRMAKK